MGFKKILTIIMLFLVIPLMLQGCARKTTTSQDNSQEKKGTQLVLTGVDKNLEGVFKENFNIVEKAHHDLIFRQDTIVRGLPQTFTEDRPDLENAILLYNANTNEAMFTYTYKPRQDDLVVSPSSATMWVKLASYHYIAKDVASYFEKVIDIMKTQGVTMKFPKIYTVFLVNSNQYLQIDQIGQFNLILDVKTSTRKDPVHINSGFASGTMQAGVSKPIKLVSGEYGNEISLLEFFNVNSTTLNTSANTPTITPFLPNMNLPDINYKNSAYGFSLAIPGWMKDFYTVREDNVNHIIHFDYVSKDIVLEVFSINRVNKGTEKEEEKNHSVSYLLGSNDKYSFMMVDDNGQSGLDYLLEPGNELELQRVQAIKELEKPGFLSFKIVTTQHRNI